tara:strand:- start:47 stop:1114 length:1068 start_codon:yes stop_codon:yes gene_type:complete
MNKIKLYRIAEPRTDEGQDRLGKIFNLFIIVLIILNCISISIETLEGYSIKRSILFYYFEIFSVFIFSAEYLFRIWIVEYNPDNQSKISRMEYIFSPMAIIDLVSILPFYISVIGYDLRGLRVLRTFRLFKIGRYTDAATQFWKVIIDRKKELIISLFFSMILMFISSYIVYLAENPKQPEKFSNIFSGIGWAVATLTPGPPAYEFAKPITLIGKLSAGLLQIIGIAIIALPTGIIGGGFAEKLKQRKTGIAMELVQYKKMEEDGLITIDDYNKKKIELLSILMKKDFIPAEKHGKLENMKKLDLIDDNDFKYYEKLIVKESEAGKISKKLEKLSKEYPKSSDNYKKLKDEILYN